MDKRVTKNSNDLVIDIHCIISEYNRDESKTSEDTERVIQSIEYGIKKFFKDNNIKIEWCPEVEEFIRRD